MGKVTEEKSLLKSILLSKPLAYLLSVSSICYSVYYLSLGDMIGSTVSIAGSQMMGYYFIWCFLAGSALSLNILLFFRTYSYDNKLARIFVYISFVMSMLIVVFPDTRTSVVQEALHIGFAFTFSILSLIAFYMCLYPLTRTGKKYLYIFIFLNSVIIGSFVYALFIQYYNGVAETIKLIAALFCLAILNIKKPQLEQA